MDNKTLDFLKFHFQSQTKYNGNIHMGISTQRGIKNTGFYSQKVFLKKIPSFFPRYENDHYISKNTFFNDKRSNDSLFSFENIVIDIDFHHLFYECIPDKVNHLLYFLQNCSLEVPIPNSYVYTGRGVQLWYRLESASYKLEKEYRMVAEDICHRLDDFISEKVDFVNCIDYAASTNPAGLVRFPFGKNTKVNQKIKNGRFHDILLNLCDYIIDHNLLKEEKEKKKKRTSSSYSNLFSYRFRMLTRLREMREDFGEGKRDFYLFAIYCSGMDMSEKERMEAVHAFNQGFTVPLSEKEIEKYLSSARKKEYYISNHWLIETFQITQEEQDLLNLYENKKKNHRECGKRAVITPEIIKSVCELAKEGLKKCEIAAKTGISNATVSKIMKKNGIKTKQEILRGKVWSLLKKGKSIAEIAQLLDVPRKHISHIGQKYNQLKKEEEEKERKHLEMVQAIAKMNEEIKKRVRDIVMGENLGNCSLEERENVRKLYHHQYIDNWKDYKRAWYLLEILIKKPIEKSLRKSIRKQYHISNRTIDRILVEYQLDEEKVKHEQLLQFAVNKIKSGMSLSELAFYIKNKFIRQEAAQTVKKEKQRLQAKAQRKRKKEFREKQCQLLYAF